MREEVTAVRVHYCGFEDSWDEWLPLGSRRLFLAPAADAARAGDEVARA